MNIRGKKQKTQCVVFAEDDRLINLFHLLQRQR